MRRLQMSTPDGVAKTQHLCKGVNHHHNRSTRPKYDDVPCSTADDILRDRNVVATAPRGGPSERA
jgi:hypothetical protein